MSSASELRGIEANIAKTENDIEALARGLERKRQQLEALKEQKWRHGGQFMCCSNPDCHREIYVAPGHHQPARWWTDHDLDDDGVCEYMCVECAQARGPQVLMEEGWSEIGKRR
jgi:hypothetical protein